MKALRTTNKFDETVTTAVLARAIARGKAQHSHGLRASAVQYLHALKSLLIGFADHSALVLPVKNYPELAQLTGPQLGRLSIGFGGGALCLEERDLHVSIAGLVSASRPLMDMAATVIAARNGSRSSEAKAAASRENGTKGGRPRKALAAG